MQLAHSLGRVALGFALAVAVALPLGFAIGTSPPLHRALDPFIQVLKPISPLAWMPLALYTLKDSSVSGVFVIFICSVWPMLINTAFGVASVRGTIQDELLKIVQATHQTVFMITHDVDEAILLADRILLMSNGPRARIAEVVEVTMPRTRTRADVHHHPNYYAIRNHLVDFLVNRSRSFAQTDAGAADARTPPVVRPTTPVSSTHKEHQTT